MPELVWFKRDLRTRDHAPLAAAAERGAVLPLYIAEPEYWKLPDVSGRHFAFAARAVEDLDGALHRLGQRLVIRSGDAVDVLRALHLQTGFTRIWAHQETGSEWTRERNRRVREWAEEKGILFHELPNNGVVVDLKNRDNWEGFWQERIRGAQVEAPGEIEGVRGLEPGWMPRADQLGIKPDPVRSLPAGGESAGQVVLDSFLQSRALQYRKGYAHPLQSVVDSSRLGPYLTWGNLSVRQVFQAERARLRGEPEGSEWRRNLEFFEARLRLRCHSIQKLETRPDLEFKSLVPAFDMLGRRMDAAKFAAWKAGETGFPLVDAAMRALQTTGWVNYRLRTLLVSFATFDLWLPWQPAAVHLARLFVDFEPGIHYPQVQLHAGTGGGRGLRIHSPSKVARELDPDGEFIRRWLPELRAVPLQYLFEPWTMPISIQRPAGCMMGRNFPEPVCDHEMQHRRALEALAALRRSDETWEQSRAVWREIGSRNTPEPRRPRAAGSNARLQQEAAGQLVMFE